MKSFRSFFLSIDKKIAPARYENKKTGQLEALPIPSGKKAFQVKRYVACGGGILAGVITMTAFQATLLGIIMAMLSLGLGLIVFHQDWLIHSGKYEEVPAICTDIENSVFNMLRLRKVCEFEVDDDNHNSFTLTFDSRIRVSKGKKYLIYFKKGSECAEQNLIRIQRF